MIYIKVHCQSNKNMEKITATLATATTTELLNSPLVSLHFAEEIDEEMMYVPM